jgi:hypothetical protein
MAEAKVTGPGVLDMQLLAAKLKDADPVLKRELRKKFRDAADPIVEDVQGSILAMPSKRKEKTLRAEVAGTVVLRTSFARNGVRVNIDSLGQRMPQGKETLPRHLDSVKGFNHPVFARGPRFRPGPSRARKYRHLAEAERPLVKRGAWTWVRQYGKPRWFEGPIADGAREFRNAALQAIKETERHLGAS